MNQAISDLFQLELPQLEARLARLLGDIMPPDEAARAACKARWDAVGKPLGSLGLLETDTQKIAALTGSAKLDLSARTLLVFCADNGVVAQGVSQCGNEVTGFVTRALAEGRSSAAPWPWSPAAGCSRWTWAFTGWSARGFPAWCAAG